VLAIRDIHTDGEDFGYIAILIQNCFVGPDNPYPFTISFNVFILILNISRGVSQDVLYHFIEITPRRFCLWKNCADYILTKDFILRKIKKNLGELIEKSDPPPGVES